MGKKLSEMSLDELWQLFPIFLTEHRDCWKDWYAEEADALTATLPQADRISHIGSTSVDTIWAKPIVDILVEVPRGILFSDIKTALLSCGYRCMWEDSERASFNKGYTENGFAQKVFHLHLRYTGDNDELFFRDYLREHAEIAKEYEKLKLELWKKYEHNRDAYTEAKTEFVKRCTDTAKQKYSGRFSNI